MSGWPTTSAKEAPRLSTRKGLDGESTKLRRKIVTHTEWGPNDPRAVSVDGNPVRTKLLSCMRRGNVNRLTDQRHVN